MAARTFRPERVPILTISSASCFASSTVRMNAPLPVLTSSMITSAPLASFLDMMEDAISGMDRTVAVTSRSAYIFLSAGTRFADCPITDTPFSRTISRKRSIGISTLVPGMDSNLSSVPPVCPRPRPLIFATVPPQAATSGATTSVVVSPTPPVLCLSSLTPGRSERSTTSPLCIIASVRSVASRAVIPFCRMAMHMEAI